MYVSKKYLVKKAAKLEDDVKISKCVHFWTWPQANSFNDLISCYKNGFG
jgi:hypothetical protein